MAINNNRLPINRLMGSDQKSKKLIRLYFYLTDIMNQNSLEKT